MADPTQPVSEVFNPDPSLRARDFLILKEKNIYKIDLAININKYSFQNSLIFFFIIQYFLAKLNKVK